MKNPVLVLMCAAALTACKKNETTVTDTSTDSSTLAMPADSSMTMDSANVSGMNGSTAALNDGDRMFADDAARAGMMEVMLGKLAATNAANSKVKALGDMMVRDHGMANDELKNWASTAGYTLPSGLDAEQQKAHDGLQAKKGAEFDKAYTEMMVTDHTDAIKKFKKQASGGTDAALKAFAGKTIPTLEHHLTESKGARDAVK